MIGMGEHEASRPIRALRALLDGAGVKSGPLFWSVNLKGRVSSKALHPRSNSMILNPPAGARGHRSGAMVRGYIRGGVAADEHDGTAGFLDAPFFSKVGPKCTLWPYLIAAILQHPG